MGKRRRRRRPTKGKAHSPPKRSKQLYEVDWDDSDEEKQCDLLTFTMSPLYMECIVEEILRHLPTKDLMASRLVCRLWEGEGAKLLLHRKYKCVIFPCPNFSLFDGANPKLKKIFHRFDMVQHLKSSMQRITTAVKRTKHPELLRGLNIDVWSNLGKERQELVRTHGKFLKQIDFGTTSKSWKETAPGVISALNEWAPNVTKLQFYDASLGQQFDFDDERDGLVPQKPFPIEITSPLKLTQLIMHLENYSDEEDVSQIEKCFGEICKSSPSLKSLTVDYNDPVKLIRILAEIPHLRENLDKLMVRCNLIGNSADAALSSIKFQRLRVLKLSNIDVNSVSFTNILRGLAGTLRKLKLGEIQMDESNPLMFGVIIKVLTLLPKLESLNWSENFYPRSYQQFFTDLEKSGVIHTSLKYLKLKEMFHSLDVAPGKLNLLALKAAFSNLERLDLFIARKRVNFRRGTRSSTRRGMTDVLMQEFKELVTFPKLKTLRTMVDDFCIGENVLGAIETLKNSTSLRDLTIINNCESCIIKSDSCDHQTDSSSEGWKELLKELKGLDTIELVGFRDFLTEREDTKEIEGCVNNLTWVDTSSFDLISDDDPKFDSEDETEIE